jgi:1,4-alpha-glucan branching enzyme
MIHKKRTTGNMVAITFEIPGALWADRINLVGDFNNWDSESLPLQPNKEGNWQIEIELEEGREYRFRYLIDGDYWGHDWHADKHAANPNGGNDSIVIASVPSTN